VEIGIVKGKGKKNDLEMFDGSKRPNKVKRTEKSRQIAATRIGDI
jgi:hypothetical protein